ncbi:MAG: radical SAM protein [Candidatus Heimdallarchaeaceae archaeon]
MKLYKLPGPWRVTFDTNPDECNLFCIMCERSMPENKHRLQNLKTPRRMPSSLIRKVVEEANELGELREIIPSTMGEPLLYKEFDVFVELCEEFEIELNLTTNGTFPRKSIEEWSNLLLPICSDIKISWNSFSKDVDESIMINRNFDKAFNNLKKLLEIRENLRKKEEKVSSITLQLTFLEQNYKEIPNIIEKAIELGIDRIKGHHLWVHYNKAENWSMRKNADSINRWNKMVDHIDKEYWELIKIENIYHINPKGEILLVNSICPFLGREVWISSEGVFSPCCAPNELRKQLGYFGNLNNVSLKEIWEGEEYNNLCLNYNKYQLCQKCNMRKDPKDVYNYGLQ